MDWSELPTPAERFAARLSTRLPGWGLVVTSGAHFCVAAVFGAGYVSKLVEGRRDAEEAVAGAGLLVFWVVSGLAVLAAGMSLRRLDSYGVVKVGCVAAMVPGVTLLPVVGFSVGVWSLVVANSPDVWRCFRRRR